MILVFVLFQSRDWDKPQSDSPIKRRDSFENDVLFASKASSSAPANGTDSTQRVASMWGAVAAGASEHTRSRELERHAHSHDFEDADPAEDESGTAVVRPILRDRPMRAVSPRPRIERVLTS